MLETCQFGSDDSRLLFRHFFFATDNLLEGRGPLKRSLTVVKVPPEGGGYINTIINRICDRVRISTATAEDCLHGQVELFAERETLSEAPAEILNLLVCRSDFRLATAGGFESHNGLSSFRDNIFNPWQKLGVFSGQLGVHASS